MHIQYISNNRTLDVNSTMKYAVIFIPGYQKFENKTVFPDLWDS